MSDNIVGSWEKSDKYKGFSFCSNCRDCYVETDWLINNKWNYCPMCGVPMKEKEIKND